MFQGKPRNTTLGDCREAISKVGGTKPNTYSEWTSICIGFTGQLTDDSQRPNVSVMRNYLYDTFVEMPTEISSFIKYPLYLQSIPYDKLIDSSRWTENEPEHTLFVNTICAIQPYSIKEKTF